MMSDQVEIMRIDVGDRQFGLLREQVRSVQHGNQVREDESGALLLRTTEGDLPVFPIAERLGLRSRHRRAAQRVVVIEDRAGLWCLLVDRVSQRERVDSRRIERLPAATIAPDAAYCQSALVGGNQLLLLLEPSRLHPHAEPLPPTNGTPDERPMPPAPVERRGGHLVLFQPVHLNDYRIGLTPKQVDDVLREARPQRVPGAPAHVTGLLPWRGRSVPVIDIAARLGVATGASEGRRLVIAHANDGQSRLAFFAEPAVDFIELPVRHRPLDELEAGIEPFVAGAARIEGATVLLPDIKRMLSIAKA